MTGKKIGKGIVIGISSIILIAVVVSFAMFARQAYVSNNINDDHSSVVSNPVYQAPVSVEGISYIEQEISCGYALIEMLSSWQGKDITEQKLFDANDGAITTAIGSGFLDEMSKQFPEWDISQQVNLSNSDLLVAIHDSLSRGMPVPIEFAAQREVEGEKVWTLHFALVTAMDLSNDTIVVQNPYGYEETYSVDDFLRATRYDSYENMELFLKFGFAFGLFHENTIYLIHDK